MSKEVLSKSATCYAAVGPKKTKNVRFSHSDPEHHDTICSIQNPMLTKFACKAITPLPHPCTRKREKEGEEAEKKAILAVVFIKQ